MATCSSGRVSESGEDYLFSSDRFIPIDVPAAVKASLLKVFLRGRPRHVPVMCASLLDPVDIRGLPAWPQGNLQ